MKLMLSATAGLLSLAGVPALASDVVAPVGIRYDAHAVANPYNRFGVHFNAAASDSGLHLLWAAPPIAAAEPGSYDPERFAWQHELQPQPPNTRWERVAHLLRHRQLQFRYTFGLR